MAATPARIVQVSASNGGVPKRAVAAEVLATARG